MSSCKPCPKGMIASEDGMAYCTACETGYFQNLQGQSACTKCSTNMEGENWVKYCWIESFIILLS